MPDLNDVPLSKILERGDVKRFVQGATDKAVEAARRRREADERDWDDLSPNEKRDMMLAGSRVRG